MLTAVDRKSMQVWLAALSSKMAAETTRALIRLLELINDRVHTITATTGKEFAQHDGVAAALGLDYYLLPAHELSEWGLSERTNAWARE